MDLPLWVVGEPPDPDGKPRLSLWAWLALMLAPLAAAACTANPPHDTTYGRALTLLRHKDCTPHARHYAEMAVRTHDPDLARYYLHEAEETC